VEELRQMLVPFQAKPELQGSIEISSAREEVGVGVKASLSGRSFAEVVRATTSSTVDSGGLKKLILGHLDDLF
jgi:hypothetical protein